MKSHPTAQAPLGGFVFDNFRIDYNSNVPFIEINATRFNFMVKDVNGAILTFSSPMTNGYYIQEAINLLPTTNQNLSINYNHS